MPLIGPLLQHTREQRVSAAWPLGLVAFAAAIPTAAADDGARLTQDFQVERFELATDFHGVLNVTGARALGSGQWQLTMWGGLERNPLILRAQTTGDTTPIIARRVAGGLGFAYGLTPWLDARVYLPLSLYQSRNDLADVVTDPPTLRAWGLGDVALMPHAALLNQHHHGVDLGVTVRMDLPTGRDEAFATNGKFSVGGTLSLGRTFGAWETLLNLGYRTRPAAGFADLQVDDELTASAGVRLALPFAANALDLSTTIATATLARAPWDEPNASAAEWLLGVGWRPQLAHHQIALQAFGGLGLGQGYGTPAWRAGVAIGYARNRHAAPPAAAPTPSLRPEPFVDSDDDGIPDDQDQCPSDAETYNGVDDQDGCPDRDDLDGDGVRDVEDLCLDEPAQGQGDRVEHDRFGCPLDR